METASIHTVSQLTDSIKFSLNEEFNDVQVIGEISGVTSPRSGHVYLTLKDRDSQLSCVMWRSNVARLVFQPVDGMQIVCRGYIDVYPQRGTYQLIAQSMVPVGQGAAQVALRQLHERLKVEGLFDSRHKQALPPFPRRIAVVTSPTGAAVHDFLQVVSRRWPFLDILIVPVSVQGVDAIKQISQAIQWCGCGLPQPPEIVVVTRGGGSVEDLWAFNDEQVVRAIFDCPIPVVSAVGHEIDVSLTDLVADVRALTPSEAGERIVPDYRDIHHRLITSSTRMRQHCLQSVGNARDRLQGMVNRPTLMQPLNNIFQAARTLDAVEADLIRGFRSRLTAARQQLNYSRDILRVMLSSFIPQAHSQLRQTMNRRCMAYPTEWIQAHRGKLAEYQRQLFETGQQLCQSRMQTIELLQEKLTGLDPTQILRRGYSLTLDEAGRPLVDCRNLHPGDKIRTQLADGEIDSRVEFVQQRLNQPPPQTNGQEAT